MLEPESDREMQMRRGAIACVVIGLALITVVVNAQPQDQSEEMYRRYLDFPRYVKGGTVEPHWMADGNSFWYAEKAPENTVIWKVDPTAKTREPMFAKERRQDALPPSSKPQCGSSPR
jgi:hypothetical protein